MFTTFTFHVLAVVVPSSSRPSFEQSGISLLIPAVVILTLLTILVLRPRRRRQEECEERTFDPRKDDYVLIPAGLYRVVKPASVGEGLVTLCVDERQGRTIVVEKAEIEGIVKPSIPPTAKSPPEQLPQVEA